MKLEELVASQKLCESFTEQFPDMFQDSAMVWLFAKEEGEVYLRMVFEEACEQNPVLCSMVKHIPAPTLEEIMHRLPFGTTVHYDFALSCWLVTLPDKSRQIGDDERAADAALRLLLPSYI